MNTTKNNAMPFPKKIHQLTQQLIDPDGDFDDAGVLNMMPIKSLQEMNDECLADIYETAPLYRDDSYTGRPMKRHKPSESSDLDNKDNNQYDEGVNICTDPICLTDLPDLNSSSFVVALLYNLGLANLQRDQGDAALRLFHLALDKCKKDEGLDNIYGSVDEISILHNIGCINYHKQEYQKALKNFTRVEVLSLIKHGSNHLSVASALNCIGVVLFNMNGTNSQNVLDKLSEALSIRQSILGSSHRDVATTLNNIGRVHFDTADFHKAILYYQESLQIRRKILGPDHVDVSATAFNAGQTCHKLGELNKSLSLYQEYFDITSKHGQNHQGTVTALKYIGQVFHEKKQVKEAQTHYEAALKSNCEAFGHINREAASILNLLGNLFYENRDFDEAIEAYEDGLSIERAVLDCDCNNILVTLSNIGQALMQKGDYQSALSKYNQVRSIQCSQAERNVKKIPEQHPPEGTDILWIIGQINTLLGKYSQAENAFLEVISATKDTTNHAIDIPLCLNYLGLVYFKQGALDSALEQFEESLRIRMVCAHKTSSDVAVLHYNIASIYLHKGDTENALNHYKSALEVERNTLGSHPDVAYTLKLIGKVYARCGQYEDAIQHFSSALEIYNHSSGHGCKDALDHKKNAAKILALIASVHLRQANTEEMTVALSRAYRLFQEIGANIDELEFETGFDLYELSILHPECAAAA